MEVPLPWAQRGYRLSLFSAGDAEVTEATAAELGCHPREEKEEGHEGLLKALIVINY